ncbi:hypothetical protein FHL15_001932 [Xylaria flabelliformis]|uniref:Uncharacterized protein n=1 Tax=Xylaria flabelliformis TaxID=2512241 RepID=A0A553IAB5_9PEZI|nr:hypothetical protein FHL15_001932 [Xylaria flabelliformis]
MDNQQITFSDPVRSGNREYRTSNDGRQWVRKLRQGAWGTWQLYTPEELPPAERSATCLWLVRQRQAVGPYHWSLAVASEEGGPGEIYQVKGDAIHMYHDHAREKNIFMSESYFDSFNLGYLDNKGREMVEHCAYRQAPPSAPNAAAIKENCQGWAVRVLGDLEAKGVVSKGTADKLTPSMEPLT